MRWTDPGDDKTIFMKNKQPLSSPGSITTFIPTPFEMAIPDFKNRYPIDFDQIDNTHHRTRTPAKNELHKRSNSTKSTHRESGRCFYHRSSIPYLLACHPLKITSPAHKIEINIFAFIQF
jgi:hypothetical protein